MLGSTEIKINKVEFYSDLSNFIGIPGAVIGIEADGFYVKTLDTYIKVVEWSGINKIKIGERLK